MSKFKAIDLFSGCGGLSEGMVKAGFDVVAAFEIDRDAVRAYQLNHKSTKVFEIDIKKVDLVEVKDFLNGEPLHFLAGCPPCQGFSSIRRLNRRASKRDTRNTLVLEYLRFVRGLKPLTVMMENVPGLINYSVFKYVVRELKKLGYSIEVKVVNLKDYGIPQRRRRLVLVGSRLGPIKIAEETNRRVTVRDAIGNLESREITKDSLHKVTARHSEKIQKMIEAIPLDGGSRKDVPEYTLACHKKANIGFNDVYGRLRWDDYAVTITGGCLNPSKGRFLHPSEHRTITAREASLLQSFPKKYKFPSVISKTSLSLLIGNALPPRFSFIQSKNIEDHITKMLKV